MSASPFSVPAGEMASVAPSSTAPAASSRPSPQVAREWRQYLDRGLSQNARPGGLEARPASAAAEGSGTRPAAPLPHAGAQLAQARAAMAPAAASPR
ncbi:MAG: hypothetical protein ACLFR7_09190, partial [Opitutales bacterium]